MNRPRRARRAVAFPFPDGSSARRWLSSVAACTALACGTGEDSDEAAGPPMYGGGIPGAPANNAANGGAGAPNINPLTPSASSGTPGTGPASTGSAPGSNEPNPVSNIPVSNGTGGANGGSAGAANAGGMMMAGGTAGAAGSSMGTPSPASPPDPPAGTNPPSESPQNPPPPQPAGPDIPCPAGATFCSGFEGAELPDDAQAHAVGPASNDAFVLDTAEVLDGEQSLMVPATGSGGFFYRALAVAVPGQDFWVRLYMRLSTPLGDNSHDSVFGASSGGLEADVNGEALVELSEQFNEVLLNTDDQLFNPEGANTISANVWHCMEAHYSGGSGNVEIFADGAPLITATGYRQLTYQSFRIGYMRYNDDRIVWYDNVVVAPNRVGCD